MDYATLNLKHEFTPQEEQATLSTLTWEAEPTGPHLRVWLFDTESGERYPTRVHLRVPETLRATQNQELETLFALTYYTNHYDENGLVMLTLEHPASRQHPLRDVFASISDPTFGLHALWDHQQFEKVTGKKLPSLDTVKAGLLEDIKRVGKDS